MYLVKLLSIGKDARYHPTPELDDGVEVERSRYRSVPRPAPSVPWNSQVLPKRKRHVGLLCQERNTHYRCDQFFAILMINNTLN
ncbi:unnamed protein product [Larinioides sclopetarius]|uniref:Uncharacterized protein n=1 Tax=Larinioides sclopetarius TaxID=280406 RepID=A0AAV2ALH7_9ARAC